MIENATNSEMGSYECMAKSPVGEVKSRQVHMKPSSDAPSNSNNIVGKGFSTIYKLYFFLLLFSNSFVVNKDVKL
jgi:hypothetical protein